MKSAAAEVFSLWASGALPPQSLTEYVGVVPDYDVAGDRLLAALGLSSIHFDGDLDDERVARRWAFTEEWLLMEQDEDLLAVQFPLHALAAASSDSSCPKAANCAWLAENQMRLRAQSAAVKGPTELRMELATIRDELSLPGDLDELDAGYYIERLEAAVSSPLRSRRQAVQLAGVIGGCCVKPRSKFMVRKIFGGYRITNIDGHETTLTVVRGRWRIGKGGAWTRPRLTGAWHDTPPPDRQRRARRAAGKDSDEATVRPAEVVEGDQQ